MISFLRWFLVVLMLWRINVNVLLITNDLKNDSCSVVLLLFKSINKLFIKEIPINWRLFWFKSLTHISWSVHYLTSNRTFCWRLNNFVVSLKSLLKLSKIFQFEVNLFVCRSLVTRIVEASVVSHFPWGIGIVKRCCLV